MWPLKRPYLSKQIRPTLSQLQSPLPRSHQASDERDVRLRLIISKSQLTRKRLEQKWTVVVSMSLHHRGFVFAMSSSRFTKTHQMSTLFPNNCWSLSLFPVSQVINFIHSEGKRAPHQARTHLDWWFRALCICNLQVSAFVESSHVNFTSDLSNSICLNTGRDLGIMRGRLVFHLIMEKKRIKILSKGV